MLAYRCHLDYCHQFFSNLLVYKFFYIKVIAYTRMLYKHEVSISSVALVVFEYCRLMLKKLLYRVKRGYRSYTGGIPEGQVEWKWKLLTNFRKEFLKGLLSMLYVACFLKEEWVISALPFILLYSKIFFYIIFATYSNKFNFAWLIFSSWKKLRWMDIIVLYVYQIYT